MILFKIYELFSKCYINGNISKASLCQLFFYFFSRNFLVLTMIPILCLTSLYCEENHQLLQE